MSDDRDRELRKDEASTKEGVEPDKSDGSPDSEQPVCAICGNPIAPDDVVCPSCGTSLAAG
jgi:rubrerythrin